MIQTQPRRQFALFALVALAIAACGTTVPQVTTLGGASNTGGSTIGAGTADAPAPEATADNVPSAAAVTPGTSVQSGAIATAGAPVIGATSAGTVAGNSPAPTAGKAAAPKGTTRASAKASTKPKASTAATTASAAATAGLPLKVGVAYPDTAEANAALGASTSQSINGEVAAKALLTGINMAGGLDGRQLVPYYYSFNSDDANYSTDASSACDMFTQDDPVPLVIDEAFGTTGGFQACLQKAGVLDLTIATEGDLASSAAASLHANTLTMDTDRRYASVINQFVASGYLSPKNQLGIIEEQCDEDENAYTNTVLPLIAKYKLKAPSMATISCTTGFASAGAASAPLANAELKFNTAGVDRVMYISGYEQVLLGLFGNVANAQGYTPGYVLSSIAETAQVRGDLPAAQWPQLHGVGNMPYLDTDLAVTPTPAPEARCAAFAKAAGVVPATQLDRFYIETYCSPYLLLEAALKADGGNSTPTTLMNAINGLGTSFSAPGTVGGAENFTSTLHDGPSGVRLFNYDASCTCVDYTGPQFPA